MAGGRTDGRTTDEASGSASGDAPRARAVMSFLLGTRETRDLVRWALYCFAIGIVTGLGAVLFTKVIDLADETFLGHLAHYYPPRPGGEAVQPPAVLPAVRQWLLVILPAVGGLLAGLLVYSLAPEAEGHGTDAVIYAFHHRQGRIPRRVPIIKIIASALTIGSGGSAGREGPIAQVGAGFGSAMGRFLGLSAADVRQLVVIGAGAGIGAVFRAPLGGALFAASVLYRETDYEYGALMPGFLASVTSYAVFSLVAGVGYEPIFLVPAGVAFTLSQLPLYFLLGLVMAPLSWVYIWIFYGLRDRLFRRLPLPRHVVPAVGGLMLGLLAWWVPAVLGVGYGWIQQAINGQLAIGFMLGVALLKIIATSLTISSGGSGGVFAPSLVIGGLAGGAVGGMLHQFHPAWFDQPAAFVLVGMAAFFAAAAKTPIASLVLVSEMTGGYTLLVPAMFAIAAAYMFSGLRWSIYENQVRNRFSSPAHRGTYVVDVLEEIPVQRVVRTNSQIETLSRETTLAEIYTLITRTRQSVFPVVEDPNRFVGSIAIAALQDVPQEGPAADLIIADDLLEQGARVRPEDNLNVALETLLRSGLDELPVVDHEGSFAGLVCRRDVLAAYYSRLKEIRGAQ